MNASPNMKRMDNIEKMMRSVDRQMNRVVKERGFLVARIKRVEADLVSANFRVDAAETKLAKEEERYTSMVDYYEALIRPIRDHFAGGHTEPAESEPEGSALSKAREYLARIRQLEALLQTVTGRSLRLEEALESIDPEAVRKALAEPRKATTAAKAPSPAHAVKPASTGLHGCVTDEWQKASKMLPVAQANGFSCGWKTLYDRLRKAAVAGEIKQRGKKGTYEWGSLNAPDDEPGKAVKKPVITDPILDVMTNKRAPFEGGYWTAARLGSASSLYSSVNSWINEKLADGTIERSPKFPGQRVKYRLTVSVDAATIDDQVFLDALDQECPISEYDLYVKLNASHRIRDEDVLSRYLMLDKSGKVSGAYEDYRWWFVLPEKELEEQSVNLAEPPPPSDLDDLRLAIEKVTGKQVPKAFVREARQPSDRTLALREVEEDILNMLKGGEWVGIDHILNNTHWLFADEDLFEVVTNRLINKGRIERNQFRLRLDPDYRT